MKLWPVQADSYSHFLSSDEILLSFLLVLLDKQHSFITTFRYCALKTLSSKTKSSQLRAYPIRCLSHSLNPAILWQFVAGGNIFLFCNLLWNSTRTFSKLSSSKNRALSSGHAQGLMELCLLKSCITKTLVDPSVTTPCPAETKQKAFIPA